MFFEKDCLPWHVVGLLVVVHVSTLDISEKLYELWNVTHLLFNISKLSVMKNIRRWS